MFAIYRHLFFFPFSWKFFPQHQNLSSPTHLSLTSIPLFCLPLISQHTHLPPTQSGWRRKSLMDYLTDTIVKSIDFEGRTIALHAQPTIITRTKRLLSHQMYHYAFFMWRLSNQLRDELFNSVVDVPLLRYFVSLFAGKPKLTIQQRSQPEIRNDFSNSWPKLNRKNQ